MSTKSGSSELQLWLDRACQGDSAATNRLIELTMNRLRLFAHTILRGDRVHQWEDTDDLLQHTLIQMQLQLSRIGPISMCDFYRLAGFHMRRTLVNLARHYLTAGGANKRLLPLPQRDSRSFLRPANLVRVSPSAAELVEKQDGWTRLKEEIDHLDDELREVVDLVGAGLTHAEAAEMIGVSTKTVQRRWQCWPGSGCTTPLTARCRGVEAMGAESHGSPASSDQLSEILLVLEDHWSGSAEEMIDDVIVRCPTAIRERIERERLYAAATERFDALAGFKAACRHLQKPFLPASLGSLALKFWLKSIAEAWAPFMGATRFSWSHGGDQGHCRGPVCFSPPAQTLSQRGRVDREPAPPEYCTNPRGG